MLELSDEFHLRIREMPTIGPRGGLPVTVRERPSRPALLRSEVAA